MEAKNAVLCWVLGPEQGAASWEQGNVLVRGRELGLEKKLLGEKQIIQGNGQSEKVAQRENEDLSHRD